MAKGEIAALKEALCNQYLIMKKLYFELEEEREASATATTEALSMILRLQREKAVEKMEASQYKRMVEERINHTEQSLAMLEEIIQQKDMEIESLRFQLEQKKTNLGIRIPNFEEMMLCENKLCYNGVFSGDEFCSDEGFLDDESFILSSTIDNFVDRHIGTSKNEVDDLFEELVANKGRSEWMHEAEEASKRVEDEVQSTSSPIGSIGSWFSAPNSHDSTDSTKIRSISPSRNENKENASSLHRQFSWKVKYSALFHDVFEVPASHNGCEPGEPCKKFLNDTILETNSEIEMPNMMPKEAVNYLFKDDEGLNKAFMGNRNESKFSTPKKGTSVNHQWALMDPGDGNGTFYSDIEQLRRRLQKLEDERVIFQEDSERGKQQLSEVLKQLNTIETHIKRSSSRKKSPMDDESSLVSIMEAVLSFSI